MNDPVIIVLRDNVSRERVEALAGEHRWHPVGDVVRGHFVLASRRFFDEVGTMIEYLEDHTSDVRYVAIDGAAQDSVGAAIRDALPSYTEAELIAELEGSGDPIVWIRGLGRLSVLRPKRMDPRWLSLWERGFQHPSRAARRAAIRTAYGCAWPELAELVGSRLEHDTELREPLEHLRAYLERDRG
jgi:hypothetical protein